MRRLLDAVLLLFALVTAPVWLIHLWRRGRLRADWRGRLGFGDRLPRAHRPRVLLFGVSVGEVSALRELAEHLASGVDEAPPCDIVIASTTETGFARARALYGDAHPVVRWPLDLPFAVDRFLDRVRPDLLVMAELEVWPVMTATCRRRGILQAVVNGRLSARSFARYRRIRRLIHASFARLDLAAVQTDAYAERFVALGAPPAHVHVTGTMKWDTARIADEVEGAEALAEAMGIDRKRPLIVAGSTAEDEEALLRRAVPPGAQLLCAPRRPESFDRAAELLAPCRRRTEGSAGDSSDRFLLDTIGELRAAYALADVVVVGRSFGSLHGSDMMEPVALGKPVIIGPSYGDFREMAEALIAGDGIQVVRAEALADTIRDFLRSPESARAMAERGRAVIRAHQGASARNAALLHALLKTRAGKENSPPRR